MDFGDLLREAGRSEHPQRVSDGDRVRERHARDQPGNQGLGKPMTCSRSQVGQEGEVLAQSTLGSPPPKKPGPAAWWRTGGAHLPESLAQLSGDRHADPPPRTWPSCPVADRESPLPQKAWPSCLVVNRGAHLPRKPGPAAQQWTGGAHLPKSLAQQPGGGTGGWSLPLLSPPAPSVDPNPLGLREARTEQQDSVGLGGLGGAAWHALSPSLRAPRDHQPGQLRFF